ncbi:MAG: hypothetical protein VR70_13755 [Rhodospirillaceae bacterium BRH_c57]|nr:MAG: hypothetical protein VR70_13755 [Rhodospirillaceae bacterium BRH_c57]
MFLDVVIAVCAAFAGSGIVYALFRLFRRKPPKWVVPVVAAIAIVGVTAHLRYDWEHRSASLLPADFVVVERLSTSTIFEPWSLIQPVVTSLLAVDTMSAKRNQARPEMVMVDLVMLRRADDTLIIRHVVDCAAKRVAPMPAEPAFDADGLPTNATWREGAPDALFTAVCPAG